MATPRDSSPARPTSVTSGWVVATGFAAWLITLWILRSIKIYDTVAAVLISMGSVLVVNTLLDVLVRKVYKNPSTGLDWKNPRPSVNRAAIKYLGMLASIAFIAALYWTFPEYYRDFFGDQKAHPVFYGYYREMLTRFLPWWLVISIPYIYFVDARQKDQRDGYYAMGMAVTLQFNKVDWKILWQHCLSWLVKGYFLPLMFTYCARDTRTFIDYDFSIIQNFRTFFEFAYYFIFLADVVIGGLGYFFSLRIFDTHVRRVEPTFLGWAVALFCYQPFWSWFSGSYFDYSNDYPWGVWLENRPIIYEIWGSVILALYVIYVWSTIMFGARFSNLTHRGILTNGPYRWTKHPAYIAKITAYWLTVVPFVVTVSISDSIRRTAMLACVSYVYYLRAKTEEVNLNTDPVYVQYSQWMKKHGLFRWLPGAKSSTA
jgi:protein-S-isoprenylcysteine O-methyltransferase Ste14